MYALTDSIPFITKVCVMKAFPVLIILMRFVPYTIILKVQKALGLQRRYLRPG